MSYRSRSFAAYCCHAMSLASRLRFACTAPRPQLRRRTVSKTTGGQGCQFVRLIAKWATLWSCRRPKMGSGDCRGAFLATTRMTCCLLWAFGDTSWAILHVLLATVRQKSLATLLTSVRLFSEHRLMSCSSPVSPILSNNEAYVYYTAAAQD